jgi:ribosomal protein S6--L-glutamate ligase
MWMYQNGGGDIIQKKMMMKLKERGIETITDLNLRYAIATNGKIICNNVVMEELDLFFSYNAGQQTQYQVYLYSLLDKFIPIINNYSAFELTEDKLKTSHTLKRAGINSSDYRLCHRDDIQTLRDVLKEFGGKLVYKPVDGWGGMGVVLIDSDATLDTLLPFLNQTDIRQFYVERYINYDKSDYRIDVVDGKFISCYGRKAPEHDWKTNVTSGGSVILREPNDELVDIAIKAAKATGLEIAGVDLIYDLEREEYIVLEVNGIPAFATPEQEKLGLDFNDKKIEAIVELIDRKVKNKDKEQ